MLTIILFIIKQTHSPSTNQLC